jgi:hypothetical protein
VSGRDVAGGAAGRPDRGVDSRVVAAADNNARWCDAVCRSHGVPTAMRAGVWVAARRSPEFYPDAVTLAPGLAAPDVLRDVEDGPGCSVKDSFADLDLAPHGFAELFAARWMFRAPAPAPATTTEWTVVQRGEAFEGWARAAELRGTIRPALLADPSVRILAVHGPDGVTAGAIANRTGSVVGVSNVFATAMPAHDLWRAVVAAVAQHFPSEPMVGYERDEALRAAMACGFRDIGPLRVWMRPGGDGAG